MTAVLSEKPAATMRALVFTDFRKNELQDLPLPGLLAPDDVLVRVRAVGVCGSDLHGYTGQSGRRTPPMVMGHEAAGVVEEVGPAVTELKPGDRVAVQPVNFCGQCAFCLEGKTSLCKNRRVLGVHADAGGAYAERLVWPARCLHKIPDTLSFADAAFAEPLGVCVHAVRLGGLQAYDSVALVGSGPIGLLTLAILKTLGLSKIFVVDLSDERLEKAKALGADITINPSREDAREVVFAHTNGLGADVTFEAVGVGATAQQAVDLAKNGGTAVWIGNNLKQIQIDMQSVVTREVRVQGSYAMNVFDFDRALQMLAGGAIDTDILLSRRATLEEGPTLFDELMADAATIKCVVEMP
jgi:L-iditol 2-dehydrogenase